MKIKSRHNIIAIVCIIISLILFINGFYRASRMSSRLSFDGLVFETRELQENDSILYSSGKNDDSYRLNYNNKYDIFFDYIYYCYRPVMVRKNTREYYKYINGDEVTGYFTEKYFYSYSELTTKAENLPQEITEENYSQLGIVIVNREKEIFSFLYGVPFLAVGVSVYLIKKTKTKNNNEVNKNE